ncbi:MAG: small multi-drug export protein, partial [Thermoplasmata archaeon]|nr:small multi-drug export protein [Thermoplasmata archaeon]
MNGTMQWLWVVMLAMLPISELRGAIPLAIGIYKLNPYASIPLIVAANFLPVPFILKFLGPVERFLRKWKFWDKLMTRIFERTRRKTRKSIEKWESLAL